MCVREMDWLLAAEMSYETRSGIESASNGRMGLGHHVTECTWRAVEGWVIEATTTQRCWKVAGEELFCNGT